MIETTNFVESLKKMQHNTEPKDNNNDLDFGEVMKHCFNSKITVHELPYSDGQVKKIRCE